MKPTKGAIRHDPPKAWGDCIRGCFCTIFHEPIEEVPHFADGGAPDLAVVDKAIDDWLAVRGYRMVALFLDGDHIDLQGVLDWVGSRNEDAVWMLSGKSSIGENHVVVCRGAKIEWDPSPVDSGIVGPCREGFWWLEFIIPRFTHVGDQYYRHFNRQIPK